MRNNHQVSSRRFNKGFTLLEMLVAISIFALLSLTAYQVLQGVLRSGEISKVHSESLTQLQRAMLIIEQDFTQIVARASRDESDNQDELRVMTAGRSLFESEDQGIEFNRLGWQNPLNLLPRSNVLRVRYRLQEGQLQRLYFLHPDLVVGQEPQVQVLLNDIETLSFRFWNDGWQSTWEPEKTLPRGIEITFSNKQYSEIRRVFLISESEVIKQ
ncbi:type II secretion system minor pseudopilin GspJ [Psychromonas antarctica]|uniref:type II secretion system minor pseudopilin GspJ n=1 Tax=Psychromonas antarctica TaxID=67573 RepID=UPI001EE997F0|nr:type II secretion system minor pseudopilin GspJ [Psychromonas antarctica]MCG6200096.1 type II secretion system minor pseudopilin GspJ [Psychromonas antarctica]